MNTEPATRKRFTPAEYSRAKMVDPYVEAWLALSGRWMHMAGSRRE